MGSKGRDVPWPCMVEAGYTHRLAQRGIDASKSMLQQASTQRVSVVPLHAQIHLHPRGSTSSWAPGLPAPHTAAVPVGIWCGNALQPTCGLMKVMHASSPAPLSVPTFSGGYPSTSSFREMMPGVVPKQKLKERRSMENLGSPGTPPHGHRVARSSQYTASSICTHVVMVGGNCGDARGVVGGGA